MNYVSLALKCHISLIRSPATIGKLNNNRILLEVQYAEWYVISTLGTSLDGVSGGAYHQGTSNWADLLVYLEHLKLLCNMRIKPNPQTHFISIEIFP